MSIVAALLLAAAPVRLPPVERCDGDPAFATFRTQVESAVKARDMAAFTALMDPAVRITFGGRFGREQFVAYWADRDGAGRQTVWSELDAVLALGCAKAIDGRGVEYRAFPSLFIGGDTLDGFTTWIALPGSTLRARPSATARRVMHIPAWTVLEELQHDGQGWVEVRTPKGRRGFVAEADVRSLIDYRLVMGKRDGVWRITGFIAGD